VATQLCATMMKKPCRQQMCSTRGKSRKQCLLAPGALSALVERVGAANDNAYDHVAHCKQKRNNNMPPSTTTAHNGDSLGTNGHSLAPFLLGRAPTE
jgi:hypothetical protein